MELHYSDTKDFDESELADLFPSVEWTSGKYPAELKQAMLGSDTVISVRDSGKLVGMINCLSDGTLTAYIHYLLVRPEYQGLGIGRSLLEQMVDCYGHCARKVLIADDEQAGFYKKCGFTAGTGTVAFFLDRDHKMTQEVV